MGMGLSEVEGAITKLTKEIERLRIVLIFNGICPRCGGKITSREGPTYHGEDPSYTSTIWDCRRCNYMHMLSNERVKLLQRGK